MDLLTRLLRIKWRYWEFVILVILMIIATCNQAWMGTLGFLAASALSWRAMLKKDEEQGNGGIRREHDPHWV